MLISEQIEFARKDSHRLDVLRDKLPDANPFKARLGPLVHLTLFATTYRYPKDGGRIPKMMPSEADLEAWARSLERLLDDAFAHFGVDPNAGDEIAARTSAPPRRAGP